MESKPAGKSRRKYDAEFRKEVLHMMEMGRSVTEVAQGLGIGSNLIYQWMKRTKQAGAAEGGQVAVVFDEEKAGLQKRIRELEMERDILKKALGIFSR